MGSLGEEKICQIICKESWFELEYLEKWEMGQIFKNEPNEICETQLLKNLKACDLFKPTIHFKSFKDCLP